MNQNRGLAPAVQWPYSTHPFHILEKNSAASFFTPVVSVHRQGILGLEALSRAVDPENFSLIEPQDLFRNMQEEDFYVKLGLDRLFRQKGLEAFSPIRSRKPHLLLFLDIEPSVLEENIVESGHLIEQIEGFHLDPRQVVLQIPLAGKWNPRQVSKFIQIHRQHHLLVCLKDIHGSAGRIQSILDFNPDLIKLEDGLVQGLARNVEKQSSVRKVVKLAHSLGIVVVAGGLDNEEDALAALELGADLVQGSYFSRDYQKSLVLTLGRKARMLFLSSRFRRRLNHRAQRDRELRLRCERIGEYLFSCFESGPAVELEEKAPSLFRQVPALECLYRLDSQGIQVGDTVINQYHIPDRKRFLFEPSAPGSDHALREYYYFLAKGLEQVLTEPYLSMNSGHFCVTAAKCMDNPSGEGFHILCADLNMAKI